MNSDWAADKAKELLATMRGMDEVDAGLFLSGALRGVRDAERFRLAKETPTATVETPPGFRKQGLRVHVGGISWWMDLPESIVTALRDAARVPDGCVRIGNVDIAANAQLPANFFTSRVDDDGCVDCGGELDTETYLAFSPDLPSASWSVFAGESWVSLTIDNGPTDLEARFTAGALASMLIGLALAQPTPARGENTHD